MRTTNLGRVAIAALLAAALVMALIYPIQSFYPAVDIRASDGADYVTLRFLFNGRSTLGECEAVTGNIARVTLRQCPQCVVTTMQCRRNLDASQRRWLTDVPLDVPSGRMANGAMLFVSSNVQQALAACKGVAEGSANSVNPVQCFAPNTLRVQSAERAPLKPSWIGILLATLAASCFGCWLMIRYEHLHAHLSHDHVDTGPQKYHQEPTPRIGGLAVMTGLLIASGGLFLNDTLHLAREFALLLLVSIPAFMGGLVEDVTKKVGVLERLLLTMLSGAAAAWLLGGILQRVDVPLIDGALQWLPFAVVFTAFAVAGIANSINIIDGYNGLASGFAIIVLAALAIVAYLVGDRLVLFSALVLCAAVAGFFVWNWPGGKIFLGDSGAYLIGFLLAELSVLLVIRNPAVSPWFPLVLLVIPVIETLYSVYRRIFMHKASAGQPDNLHLHQLIHDKVVVGRSAAQDPLSANSGVAKYFWGATALTSALGCVFWQSQGYLGVVVGVAAVSYIIVYKRLS